ncbi:sigma-70 family RNA polymerase sigma factor [Rhizobacter sp. Root1221]|uniref:sigma-70 family RNA polymerase sigma factor n=1 Tax=Rhizobacter sp. Root1221 TaxID=1736433 RepID=UPI0006F45EDE|nr:sigma-70 family RNA polymerase sigma factor [Rhizobacter sp. Root1221]KQV89794.1 RNA polymerase subunit sigma [Rhizobacter sp. Root1221]
MPVADPALQHDVRALYSHHHGWLYGWLRKKLGDSSDAADLAHDTFLRIISSQKPVAVLQQPRAYLATIAKGILVNWYRRRALEQAYLAALACHPEAEAPSPEQHLSILQTLYEIDAMLDRLPPRTKRTFLLSQLEGLKYEEIAAALNVSLITVKRDMKAAFAQCLAAMA